MTPATLAACPSTEPLTNVSLSTTCKLEDTVKSMFAMLAVVGTCAAAAQTPEGKRPWAWTTEQRLAARFDSVSIGQRKAAYGAQLPEASRGASDPVAGAEQRLEYVIEGRRNPELFLPFELVRGLLDAGFDADMNRRALNRALYRDGIAALGVNEADFWSLLATSQERARRPHLATAVDADTVVCRVRVAVLDGMRQRFGRDVFDQFLYVTVAPYTSLSSSTTNTHSGKMELLREEAGCQN